MPLRLPDDDPKQRRLANRAARLHEHDAIRGWCRLAGLPEPVFEYRFHATRLWRFDWAWPDRKVAVEIDGGIWLEGGGAHTRPRNVLRDMEKHTAAATAGWKVLRYTPQQLKSGNVYTALIDVFKGQR